MTLDDLAPAPDSPRPAPLRTVGWVHVRDGRLLAVRTTGKDRFFMPGGKVEPGELAWITPADAHRVPPAGRIVLDRLADLLAG
ncbi:hypothetical protein V5D56_05485 [Cellulosimicrobium sp. PMB13]|uniref:hypothetical protein n=1 Tax=Cellulosimicrobium sp. PMB13 TaxID=3120158 RepID=UPI003F4BFC43